MLPVQTCGFILTEKGAFKQSSMTHVIQQWWVDAAVIVNERAK